MAREIIFPKTDIIFKIMFMKNDDMLQSFLAAMLDIPADEITDIVITNSELPPEMPSGKFTRFDLSMRVAMRLINVEVQLKNEENFRDRALLYWSRLYSSGIKSGDEYGVLGQAVTINLINFNMFDDDLMHHNVKLTVKETGEIFSDKLDIHFMELRKLGKEINPNDMRELWLQFINAESEEVFNMIEQTNIPIMKKAVRVIYDMSEDTRIKEMVRMREKAAHDEATAIGAAARKGMAKGLAKGRAEGRAEERAMIAANLKAMGMTEEQIKAALKQ